MSTDERFDRVDASIERLTQYILDFRREAATRLQAMDNRFDVLASTLASLDARQPALKRSSISGRWPPNFCGNKRG